MVGIRAMRFLLTAILVLTALACDPRDAVAETPEAYGPCAQQADHYRAAWAQNRLTPGIAWTAWAVLLGRYWSNEDIARRDFFDPESVERAAVSFAGFAHRLPGSYRADFQRYRSPAGSGDARYREAYEAAAAPYRSGDWSTAIPLFDAVVADPDSPYRAAAAYSAARAAIKAGRLGEAIGRIDRLVADPSLREFHFAAHRLLGTMAYRTGAVHEIAARLAEISHLLTAPPVLICQDAMLQRIVAQAKQDIAWHLGAAFPRNRFAVLQAGSTTRFVLDRLAEADPVLDIARVIAAPTPHRLDHGWHERPETGDLLGPIGIVDRDLPARREAERDAAELTWHARERWLATKNPLWGYALAQRTTDAADIDMIREMIAALSSLPDTPWTRAARPALHWHYLHHGVRGLLMAGRIDDAISLLSHAGDPAAGRRAMYLYGVHRYRRAILDGGVRYLLEKFDLDGALRWAAAAGEIVKQPLNPSLRVWLAEGFGDLKQSWKSPGGVRPALAIIDLLPARRIVALADDPAITAEQRRVFLSVGWLRSYLLGRWDEVKALLPRMRAAFPELATDIDNITDAWLDSTRRRLVARMLLRAPGLVPRTRWGRGTPQRGRRYSAGFLALDIFSTDNANPNDGNWWCSPDVGQLKIELVKAFFAETLYVPPSSYIDYWPEDGTGAHYTRNGAVYLDPARRRRALQLADRIIAWHPLLKDFDAQEMEALSKAESGPRLLSGRAIRWANETGWLSRLLGRDERLPETLHLAVRSTRYGCRRDGGHGAYSRTAFRKLHDAYPKSEWTRRTPYWFDRPGR